MYQVAMSADGYLAGPNGEHDWITMDPSIDFMAQCGQITVLGPSAVVRAMSQAAES